MDIDMTTDTTTDDQVTTTDITEDNKRHDSGH